MPPTQISTTPGLPSFLRSLKQHPVDSSIEHLTSLLKRRQIKHSRPCAVATAHLLLRVVSSFRWADVETLIERVRQVGQRLYAAQPRELAVGNIVRRVLGLIREEIEADRDADPSASSEGGTESQRSDFAAIESRSMHRPNLSSSISTFSPLSHGAIQPKDAATNTGVKLGVDGLSESIYKPSSHPMQRPSLISSHKSYAVSQAAPMATSMFDLLSHEDTESAASTPPGAQSPGSKNSLTARSLARFGSVLQRELKPDIISGIEEIIDELGQVDDQIAAYALEHIHANEIILTHSTSLTVQKFLLKAAGKRRFTVVHAESTADGEGMVSSSTNGTPDDDILAKDAFRKPLMAAGVTVVVIPDSAVFALMSRVNKVILGTHAVLANGGLVAAAGARMIAKAARTHRTPVVIVSGVYKLSPVYPFDFEALIEYGDASRVFPYQDGEMVEGVDVQNPLYDYVPADMVDLYITNLGGHAPSYLYRIVSDHYRVEDINLQQ
ncbi:MAG: GCD complex subunit gcd7 [Lichina confinis]|nr:MAG: GCD complex subunit gcd7 [Lichina confinis]